MYFYLIGIDYKIAPIEIREAAYWQRARLNGFLAEHYADRATILSTCNRFEIYGLTENRHEAEAAVADLKGRFAAFFNGAYVVYQENNVLRHLVRLAAGVESQVLGELQISGQLGAWAGQDRFPVSLGRLVYDALLAANDIRIEHGLNRPEKNIAVHIYDRVLAEAGPDRLLNMVVLGTGSIASLFADYKPRDVRLSFAARKNILKAAGLAERSGGDAFLLQELPGRLVDADVLISATASPHRILGKNYFSKIAMLRKKDLYVYDLALPRDIEPAVKDIEGIVLRNMDEVTLNADVKNRHTSESFSR
jgi:glutamyl-tRNA reductase